MPHQSNMTNLASIKMEGGALKSERAKKEEEKRKQAYSEDLRHLHTACYHEKRLTRAFLLQVNMLAIIKKFQSKIETENHDFKTLSPLIAGLAKLYHKKLQALISESSQTLESMKNPFAQQQEKQRKKYNRQGGQDAGARAGRQKVLTGAKLLD